MRKMKTWLVVLGMIATMAVCGCGGASFDSAKSEAAMESADVTTGYYGEAEAPAAEEAVAEEEVMEEYSMDVEQMEQKLIITEHLNVETQEFDVFWANVNQKVETLDGYIEASEISGQVEYADRYGELTIRIPADKLNDFIIAVDEKGTVTYQSKTTENVTLEYVDTESYLNALKVEEDTLLSLLEKANKLSDVFDIQARLTEIRYQIEAYASKLRVMDNQVDYSTVYLSVREVMRETEVAPRGFWSEASAEFMDSLYSVGDGFRFTAIWFIGNLPVLVIYAVIIAILVLLARKISKRSQKRMQEVMKNVRIKETKEDNDDSIQ